MPVGAVSRSQISHFQREFKLHFSYIELEAVTAESTSFVSGLNGALAGENFTGNLLLQQFVTLPFTPSRLRTRYAIDAFAVSLPPLELWAEASAEACEVESEIGWIAVLNVAGQLYIQKLSSTSITTGKLEAGKHTPRLNKLRGVNERVEFFSGVEIVPGSTFEVFIVPFMQVTTVKGKLELVRLTDSPPFVLIKNPVPIYTGVIYYQQTGPQENYVDGW